MQFRRPDQEAIARGELTLTFRRWRRPQARVGGRYRVGTNVIEVTSVEVIEPTAITVEDALAAGYESPAAALDAILRNQRRTGDANAAIYRVAFHCLGEQVDPRKELAADAELDSDELSNVTERLETMDMRSRQGPWTRAVLESIDANPGRRAGDLATEHGRETAKFKADVRKLKALGLTISLEVGYELSPRGRVILEAMRNAVPSD